MFKTKPERQNGRYIDRMNVGRMIGEIQLRPVFAVGSGIPNPIDCYLKRFGAKMGNIRPSICKIYALGTASGLNLKNC